MLKKLILTISLIALSIFIAILSTHTYFQNQNINKLLNKNLDGRVIPHKVNYINKLQNVLSDNIHSFEFDVNFNNLEKNPYFEVGHDKKELKGISFEKYLKILKNKKIKKIWMDIKNVNDKNINQILQRLKYLDKLYNIKNILIFETSSTSSKVKIISDAGFHTSYYLPVDKFFTINKNDKQQIKQLSNLIKHQILTQNLKAISFPTYIYPFVKNNIEPIISKDIVYHVWNHYKFKKKNEISKILEKDFFSDSRVKTILYSYDNNKLNRLYSF
jgi:hypothetical protein